MNIELNEKVTFLNTLLSATVANYENNGNTAIMLVNNETEIFAIASVNITKLPKDHVAIKNYLENSGMERSLIEGGVIESEAIDSLKSGLVEIPVYKLTKSVINQLNS